MKKLLLAFLALATLTFSSCSDDDTPAAPRLSKVMATINGTPLIFDYVTVERQQYDGYADLNVVATTEADPDNWIKFTFQEGVTGTDVFWFDFAYYIDFIWYEKTGDVNLVVTENNENRLQGTFSGTVEHWDPNVNEPITITNGTFDIYR